MLRKIALTIVPKSIQARLSRLGQFFERQAGTYFPSEESSFRVLLKKGFRPSHCIDVGAFEGNWALSFSRVFPNCSVLMVEPQENKVAYLQGKALEQLPKGTRYVTALLGADDNTEVEFITMGTGSSVFEEISSFPRTRAQRTLTKLDTLLFDFPEFSRAGVLKLDAQGYELEILKGAELLLESVDVIIMEVSVIPYNINAPLHAEVVHVLEKYNFRMFDYCSQMRNESGVLSQMDVMFIRSGSDLALWIRQ